MQNGQRTVGIQQTFPSTPSFGSLHQLLQCITHLFCFSCPFLLHNALELIFLKKINVILLPLCLKNLQHFLFSYGTKSKFLNMVSSNWLSCPFSSRPVTLKYWLVTNYFMYILVYISPHSEPSGYNSLPMPKFFCPTGKLLHPPQDLPEKLSIYDNKSSVTKDRSFYKAKKTINKMKR